jgi:hypothetical protein
MYTNDHSGRGDCGRHEGNGRLQCFVKLHHNGQIGGRQYRLISTMQQLFRLSTDASGSYVTPIRH